MALLEKEQVSGNLRVVMVVRSMGPYAKTSTLTYEDVEGSELQTFMDGFELFVEDGEKFAKTARLQNVTLKVTVEEYNSVYRKLVACKK